MPWSRARPLLRGQTPFARGKTNNWTETGVGGQGVSTKLTNYSSLNGFVAKCFLCMLPAPLTIFVMELGGIFSQEAYFKAAEAHRLWAFLSLVLPPPFPSFFLSFPLFLFKIKRTTRDHAICTPRRMPLQCPTGPPIAFARNTVDGMGGESERPFPSLQPHEPPANAGLLFS